jgi:hypothetical protein
MMAIRFPFYEGRSVCLVARTDYYFPTLFLEEMAGLNVPRLGSLAAGCWERKAQIYLFPATKKPAANTKDAASSAAGTSEDDDDDEGRAQLLVAEDVAATHRQRPTTSFGKQKVAKVRGSSPKPSGNHKRHTRKRQESTRTKRHM